MKTKPLIAFATSLSMMTAMLPFDLAYAGGYRGNHSYGGGSFGPRGCKTGGSQSANKNFSYNVYKPVNVTSNVDNSKNTNVYKPVHVTNNIDNSKNTTVNKYIDNSKNTNVTNNFTKNIDNSKNYNITKNIDNSKNTTINKNINITKNIDNSKYIDNSKNTYIDNSKSTNVSNSSASADATAIAAAVAAAVAASNSSSSATVNNYNNSNTTPGGGGGNTIIGVNAAAAAAAASQSGGGGGAYISDQGMYQGGNFAVAVDMSAPVQQCVYQEATVVKAIHATCISAGGNEFPASHMTGATWLDASYEGEVMRCIPGSHLKITVGEVVQSDQGMASSFTHGQQIECGEHEALRHYKDGMLKCAIAVPVPDCTERTNLRRWGTGDMFFSYRTKVCAQTHREYSEASEQEESMSSESSSESSSGEMVLKGMQLDGGIGAGSN